jgi:hypothetical protein
MSIFEIMKGSISEPQTLGASLVSNLNSII